jgi:hypothetical protein
MAFPCHLLVEPPDRFLVGECAQDSWLGVIEERVEQRESADPLLSGGCQVGIGYRGQGAA